MALTYLAIELILRDLVTDTGSNQTGHPVSTATENKDIDEPNDTEFVVSL
jgi:hypothetical protein